MWVGEADFTCESAIRRGINWDIHASVKEFTILGLVSTLPVRTGWAESLARTVVSFGGFVLGRVCNPLVKRRRRYIETGMAVFEAWNLKHLLYGERTECCWTSLITVCFEAESDIWDLGTLDHGGIAGRRVKLVVFDGEIHLGKFQWCRTWQLLVNASNVNRRIQQDENGRHT